MRGSRRAASPEVRARGPVHGVRGRVGIRAVDLVARRTHGMSIVMASRKARESSSRASVVRRSIGCPLVAASFVSLISAAALGQQPEHAHGARADTARAPMRVGPLGIPHTREASGTSWLPDFSPMYAFHWRAGRWDLMLHGNAFLYYVDEGSDRGDEDVGS